MLFEGATVLPRLQKAVGFDDEAALADVNLANE